MMRNGTHNVGECSSSTSASSEQDIEDDSTITVLLSEEYDKLDAAVRQRLSSLAPVPHIPCINTYFPNINDASLDHQRLLQRLNVYGLIEVKVSGDRNCQFHALADQIFRSPEYHKHIRKKVVKQLCPNEVQEILKEYGCGEWGDHVTLQAAADKWRIGVEHVASLVGKDINYLSIRLSMYLYKQYLHITVLDVKTKICLLTSFRDACFIEIIQQYQASKRGRLQRSIKGNLISPPF